MKMGDEILSKLLDKSDVLELDEDTLAEHLLFINNVTLKGPSQPHLCFCLHARTWL